MAEMGKLTFVHNYCNSINALDQLFLYFLYKDDESTKETYFNFVLVK